MVAPTHQQQHQQLQQQQPPQSAVATTAEDEALKRETDCVYFLASPLTCKKGSECEYRHSEYARVNPRDCYYWLNGKCLNPKCPYRHPPLDGLFGAEDATPSGPAFPLLHSTAAPAINTPHSSGKPVPCLFFSKGLCLKGDRCAFLHGPNPSSNKALQPMALAPGSGSMPVKKAVGGLQKCSQEQKITAANFPKAVETAPVAKPAKKANTAPPRNGLDFERKAPQPKSMNVDIARNKTTNLPPIVNGNSHANRLHQSQVVDDHVFQNGKDGDDFLRESSPGFDVLVDDELRESDYYRDEDQYGRTRGPEGRNLNSVEEYGMGRSTDYNSMVDVDQEAYHDRRGYDSYEPRQGQYGSWEQRRASPERMVVEPGQRDRRGHSKADSGKHISESDLRYRLSKHRSNGLKSVVSHDFAPESRVEERGYRGSSRRDSHRSPSHESSISSRLRGRIKLPGRSADNDSDVHAERGDRARNWGRLSPGRSQISSQEGRLRNRIKDRLEEDHSEGKKFSGPQMNKEIIDQGSYGFAAPRRLAELKVVKNAEGRVQQSLGKRKYIDDQQSEASLSFDGPMPLSEILKRKRETGGAASGGGISSNKKDDSSHNASRESFVDSSHNKAVADTRSELSSVIKGEAEGQLHKDNEQRSKSGTASAIAEVENTEGSAPGQSSGLPNADLETEEGMIVEEGMEEPEYEGDYQEGDEEYEYEEGEEGDYTYEEGENVDPEEDYVEEEDGNNDYASNVDAVLS